MQLQIKLLSMLLLAAVAQPAIAATPINQTRPLDPRGRVEVDNVKGRVEVVAWNRPEVPCARSARSSRTAVYPRIATSRTTPTPVEPPPMTTTSTANSRTKSPI